MLVILGLLISLVAESLYKQEKKLLVNWEGIVFVSNFWDWCLKK